MDLHTRKKKQIMIFEATLYGFCSIQKYDENFINLRARYWKKYIKNFLYDTQHCLIRITLKQHNQHVIYKMRVCNAKVKVTGVSCVSLLL